MNTKIIDAMSYIDPVYIDEHIKRASEKPKSLPVKQLTAAASAAVIGVSALALWNSGLIAEPPVAGNTTHSPVTGSPAVPPITGIEPPATVPPATSAPTLDLPVIYGDDDIFENNEYLRPPPDGTVEVVRTLRDTMDEHGDGCLYAVRIEIGSGAYTAERRDEERALYEKYNSIGAAIEEHAHVTHGCGLDDSYLGCPEYIRLGEEYAAAYAAIQEFLSDGSGYTEIWERGIEHLRSLGTDVRVQYYMSGWKPGVKYSFIMLRLTREQIEAITAPEDIWLRASPAPEWMDTDDEIVYFSIFDTPLENQ